MSFVDSPPGRVIIRDGASAAARDIERPARREFSLAIERRQQMAGSQSLSPQPVHPSRPRRRFTLTEANRSLPLVRRIVADIVQAQQVASELHTQAELLSGRDQQDAQGELQRQVSRLQEYVDELTEVGVELKDYHVGLIDFIARHQGRDIYLCWKLGEDQITHWHELQDGFAGRQPVSLLEDSE
jgi:hypothetical protein